jgi:hypothetical protein
MTFFSKAFGIKRIKSKTWELVKKFYLSEREKENY